MTAAFNVYLDSGGSDNTPATKAIITNLRFRTDDLNAVDTVNPIPIESATTNLSFWRQIYLKCATAPDTKVDNLKFYTDGTGFGTGVTLAVGLQFPSNEVANDAGYDLPDGTAGATGETMTTHTDITQTASAFTYTSGSSLTGPSISEASTQIDAINEESDYLCLQLEVSQSASPGTLSAETLTFQYDEI